MNISAILEGKDVRIVGMVPSQVVGSYYILYVDLSDNNLYMSSTARDKFIFPLAKKAKIIKSDVSRFDNLNGHTPPSIDDDETKGYSKGSLWLDHKSSAVYFCFDSERGSAKWIKQQESEIRWSFSEDFEKGWFIDTVFSKLFSEDFEWTFVDNFETGWTISNIFNLIFSDDFGGEWQEPGTYIVQMSDAFDIDWVTDNEFNSIFTDNFDLDWFINNLFNKLLSDNFHVDWFTDNPFTLIYTENFENGEY